MGTDLGMTQCFSGPYYTSLFWLCCYVGQLASCFMTTSLANFRSLIQIILSRLRINLYRLINVQLTFLLVLPGSALQIIFHDISVEGFIQIISHTYSRKSNYSKWLPFIMLKIQTINRISFGTNPSRKLILFAYCVLIST